MNVLVPLSQGQPVFLHGCPAYQRRPCRPFFLLSSHLCRLHENQAGKHFWSPFVCPAGIVQLQRTDGEGRGKSMRERPRALFSHLCVPFVLHSACRYPNAETESATEPCSQHLAKPGSNVSKFWTPVKWTLSPLSCLFNLGARDKCQLWKWFVAEQVSSLLWQAITGRSLFQTSPSTKMLVPTTVVSLWCPCCTGFCCWFCAGREHEAQSNQTQSRMMKNQYSSVVIYCLC